MKFYHILRLIVIKVLRWCFGSLTLGSKKLTLESCISHQLALNMLAMTHIWNCKGKYYGTAQIQNKLFFWGDFNSQTGEKEDFCPFDDYISEIYGLQVLAGDTDEIIDRFFKNNAPLSPHVCFILVLILISVFLR